MTDYECQDLLFWVWLLRSQVPTDEQRKEVITSAQQCKRISDVLAADLIWCFRLENA